MKSFQTFLAFNSCEISTEQTNLSKEGIIEKQQIDDFKHIFQIWIRKLKIQKLVWPDLATFCHFGKILKLFGNFYRFIKHLLDKIIKLLWQYFNATQVCVIVAIIERNILLSGHTEYNGDSKLTVGTRTQVILHQIAPRLNGRETKLVQNRPIDDA